MMSAQVGAGLSEAPGVCQAVPGPSRPRVVGLDGSLTSYGVAAVHAGVWVGRLVPGKRRGHERLAWLLAEVAKVTEGADLVVIEGLSFGSKGSAVTDLAGLWWLTTHMLWAAGIPYATVVPSRRAMYATGRGSGVGKDQVLAAAIRRYPDVPVDGNDQADALVLAAMGADWLGHPLAPVPVTHRRALAPPKGKAPGVAWPVPAGGTG